jgi:SAM-dependent methyltransferase
MRLTGRKCLCCGHDVRIVERSVRDGGLASYRVQAGQLAHCAHCGHGTLLDLRPPDYVGDEYLESFNPGLTLDDIYRSYYDTAYQRAVALGDIRGKKLLDVGCGVGCFVDAARQRGAVAEGAELGDRLREYCHRKGLVVYRALEEAPRDYDLAIAGHVLEHMDDPQAFASEMGRHLKPGGRLVFVVPNRSQVASKSPFTDRIWHYQRAHRQYFTPASILSMMERIGYAGEARTLNETNTVFTIDRMFSSMGLYRPLRPLIVGLPYVMLKLGFDRHLWGLLNRLAWGDAIIYVGKKRD